MSTRKYNYAKNRNSRLKSGRLKTEKGFRTYTTGRDDGALNVSVVSRDGGATSLKLYSDDLYVDFDGFEARTLYETLKKHYLTTGRAL